MQLETRRMSFLKMSSRTGTHQSGAIGLASPLWVTPHGISPKTDRSPPHTQHTLGMGCSRS